MTQRLDPQPTLSRLSRHRSPALFATVVGLVIGLVAAPMVGIVPVSAARAEVVVGGWAALQSAFSAGGTQTVTLGGNIVAPTGGSLTLVDGDAVVLDLNGYHLTIGSPADSHAAIGVPGGAALTVRDTGGGGKLTALGGFASAAIGGASADSDGETVGEVIIAGGTINVTGGRWGAAIGGGWGSGAGTILITGGSVTAKGNESSPGIGGGQQNPGTGTITITGGTVNARGANAAAGIGGGNRGNGIITTITGGSVTATGGPSYGAGIGGGYRGDGADVTLSGGRVIAQGGAYAAGIGGGFYGSGSTQTHPGTLTVIGTAAEGSALDGASGYTGSSTPPGPAPDFTLVAGPKGYFATSSVPSYGGRFTIDFEWFAAFDAAGGAPTPETQLASAGGTLTEPVPPIREHYYFTSWHADTADGAAWDFATSSSNRDLTLVARWSPVVYELNYDLAGGTDDGANSPNYTVESETITLTTPHRTGYAFLGWSGTGLSGTVASVTIPAGSTGDRSYTAHWAIITYTLSYHLGGGTGDGANPSDYTVESEAFTLTPPHRADYIFLGWSGTGVDEVTNPVTIPTGSFGHRDYTAQWNPVVYTLDYDFGGGTDEGANPTSYTVESGAITLTTPQRAGYAFLGWTGTGLSGTAGSVTIPTGSAGNRAYTAHWTLVGYALNYDLGGGTDSGMNPTSYTVESEAFTLTPPHRADYIFLGWSGTGLSGTVESVTIPNGSTGDRSYLANWESDTPTNTVLPTISGGTGLGETLTATLGSWDLGGLSYAYQWYRGSQPITAADSASYVLVTEDLGTTVSVEITAARAGDDRYHPATARSAGVLIALGTLAPAPTPTITGTAAGNAAVGTLLTAVPGTWGPGAIDFSYQWYLDGVPLTGATASTFTPDATHLGAAITATVTGTRANYAAQTRHSTAVTVVLGEFTPGGVLEISGTPGVGHVLAVSDESWLPDTATLSYVWLRDGVPIADATAASYTLDIADEEVLVAVTVTVSIPGYHDTILTIAPVTVDAEPAIIPNAPDQDSLTEAARGGVGADRDGKTVALTVPGVGPDPRWVYVYGFSTPTGLGWHRTIDGVVAVDVSGLGAGTHRLAVLTVSGSLTGWASIDIPALAFTGTANLAPLIGLAVLLVLLGGMVAWLRPLHRRSNQ